MRRDNRCPIHSSTHTPSLEFRGGYQRLTRSVPPKNPPQPHHSMQRQATHDISPIAPFQFARCLSSVVTNVALLHHLALLGHLAVFKRPAKGARFRGLLRGLWTQQENDRRDTPMNRSHISLSGYGEADASRVHHPQPLGALIRPSIPRACD